MKQNIIRLLFLLFSISLFAQEYQFKTIIDIETSEVKSQGYTGTCWSFATSSFLESEIFRITGKQVDVSEMFLVRNTYDQKAWNYVMRQGKTQLSEGGLAHDVINAVADFGIAPQIAFTDIYGNGTTYNHNDVIPKIKKILDAYIKNDINSEYPNWKKEITPILDKQIGKNISKFQYENEYFTPYSFREHLKIIPENYVSITSFLHEKYFSSFVLNIPDNFSNGNFYNVPLDMLVNIATASLKKGYSISLDVDVSEKTFYTKKGIAILPQESVIKDKGFFIIPTEIEVTAKMRQTEFENFNTTDDHLMHITGLVQDQNGNSYYKVKNSWGGNSKRIGNNGFIYMSIPYFKLKTISILLHKDALDKEIKKTLNL